MTLTATIKSLTAAEFVVTVAAIDGHTRPGRIVLARQVAMALVRKHTGLSLPRIGQMFGNRDHTTVLHALVRVPERCGADPGLVERIERVELGLGRISA